MAYLIKTSALLLLFFLAYKAFLQRETFFRTNRWFLLSGLFIAFLFPLIVIPIYETQVITVPAINATEQLFVPTIIEGSLNNSAIASSANSFSWIALLKDLYWVGVLMFSIRFTIQLCAVLRIIMSGKRKPFQGYSIIETHRNIAPFSFFKTIIYNPSQIADKAIEHILLHEKAHAKDWHSIDIILSELALIAMWFNPLMWWYQKSIKQNLEFNADAQSVKEAVCAKTYQTVLVNQTLPDYQIAIVNNFHSSFLKKRIIMINKSKSKSLQKLKMVYVIPFLVLFLYNFSTEKRTEIVTELMPPKYHTQLTPSGLNLGNTVEVVFTKETTKESFEKIKATLKKEGVDMEILEINRGENNHITRIHIQFTTANGSTNYNVADEQGIAPFQFRMTDDGSFGVKTLKTPKVVTGQKVVTGLKTVPHKTSTNVWIQDNGSRVNITELDSISGDKHFIIKEGDTIFYEVHSNIQRHNLFEFDEDYNFKVTPGGSSDSLFVIKMDSLNLKYAIETSPYVFISKPKGSKTVRVREGLGNDEPLIIVNGQKLASQNIHNIDAEQIKSVTVLKGESAKSLYGKQAEDGAIIVTTKGSWSPNGQEKTYTLSNIEYIVESDYTAAPTLYKIDKLSTGIELDKLKEKIESSGVAVKYSKLKRNELGEIIGIKISLSDKAGNKSSATFKSDDGIVPIYFGKQNGSLIVSSNPPR